MVGDGADSPLRFPPRHVSPLRQSDLDSYPGTNTFDPLYHLQPLPTVASDFNFSVDQPFFSSSSASPYDFDSWISGSDDIDDEISKRVDLMFSNPQSGLNEFDQFNAISQPNLNQNSLFGDMGNTFPFPDGSQPSSFSYPANGDDFVLFSQGEPFFPNSEHIPASSNNSIYPPPLSLEFDPSPKVIYSNELPNYLSQNSYTDSPDASNIGGSFASTPSLGSISTPNTGLDSANKQHTPKRASPQKDNLILFVDNADKRAASKARNTLTARKYRGSKRKARSK